MNPPYKILIVEDEAAMLKALNDTFTAAGFTVYLARNGEEGINAAFSQKPDLILLDILMPKIGGMEMMKMLRKDSWGKNVPVVILTNVNPDNNEILFGVAEHQPAYYLIKSDVTLEGILGKVNEVLKAA